MKVAVKRQFLIETLSENREKHHAIFLEAIEGYKKTAIETLTKNIDRIKNGSLKQVYIHMPMPEDHTDEYDVLIALMENSGSFEVELTPEEYARYVLDNWSWKKQFLYSNKAYSVTASNILRDSGDDDDD